jgi:hypothetical protein
MVRRIATAAAVGRYWAERPRAEGAALLSERLGRLPAASSPADLAPASGKIHMASTMKMAVIITNVCQRRANGGINRVPTPAKDRATRFCYSR